MTKSAFTFLSADKKTTIHAIRWQPEGEIRAVLQIAHGMVEYIDRYDEFATFLAGHGYLVSGHDHLGHGDSVRSRDDWGYIADVSRPDRVLVEDMHALRTILQTEYTDKPFFILGHSFGSYLLREYLALHGEGLNGAIVMGTGHVSQGTSLLGLSLISLISLFKGKRYRSELMRNMSYSKSYKQYDVIGHDQGNSWLTKDRAIVKAYYEEPRCTFLFTLNGYQALLEAVQYACSEEHVRLIPKDLPVLLASGAEDPVGDLSVGVRKVQEMMMHAGIRDLTCRLYPDDRHEILNETDRQQVYEDLLSWMDARNNVEKQSKSSGKPGFDKAKSAEAIDDAMENIFI
ncbi:MAG: alpha/beta fold hydrolase [Lachnospiraceae bacterium]|nr:alpha/beta fold hydrolase [Lachnospiraceae bacterium]